MQGMRLKQLSDESSLSKNNQQQRGTSPPQPTWHDNINSDSTSDNNTPDSARQIDGDAKNIEVELRIRFCCFVVHGDPQESIKGE
jgi:hypothetical protein